MKKPWHSRYFEISFFTAATAVFVSAVFLIMNNIDVIFKSLCQGFFWVIGIFTPVYICGSGVCAGPGCGFFSE